MYDERNANSSSSSKLKVSTMNRLDELFADRILAMPCDVAAILGIEVRSLRALCRSGRIQCVVTGDGRERPRRRFTREHVRAFLDAPAPAEVREGGTIEASRVREAVRRRIAAVRS